MPNILLSGTDFSYDVEYKPIRSIRLRLKTQTSFVVSCHRLTPSFIITKFIRDHSRWIIKNSAKIHQAVPLAKKKSLNILDSVYRLITRLARTNSVVILPEEHQIIINTTSLSCTHLRQLYNKKFRNFALKLIKTELSVLSQAHGFRYGKVSVRNQTSRFGSCAHSGNLSFNWQIIFFPKAIFRHVLLHELTHTICHNHSTKYWNQLAIYDPQWRNHRSYLRTHGTDHFIL